MDDIRKISEYYYEFGDVPWGDVPEASIKAWIERYELYSRKFFKPRTENTLKNRFE